MRIALAGLQHETSTCVETRTTLKDFEFGRGITRGDDILTRFTNTNICIGGFIEGAEKYDFQPVPLLHAGAFPGGLIVRDDYEILKKEILDRLAEAEREGGPVDGVLLELHGAMVVDGIDDGDGDMIAAVRQAVGPEIPIVITQDLHGNHTQFRVEQADAIVGYDTFPHVDMAERGVEAAKIISETLRGKIQPRMAIYQLPMFWSTRCQITEHPPMDDVIRQLHLMEERPGIVCMTVSTGFPWADVPEVGCSVIVVTDGDQELAQATANEFGEWIWERRSRWYAPPVKARDALAEGEEIGKHPIILADHTDNTGGGAPGDSTEILQTFIDMQLEDALLLYLVDAEVAKQAHAAGVGETIAVSLGGKSHPAQGQPVDAEAEVVALSTGEFAYDGPMLAGLKGNMGTSAWLRIGGISVVVVTAREQPFDPAFSRSLGIDCAAMKYIGIKSSAHFRAAFEPIAGSIFNVDAAGIHTHVFKDLPFKKRTRPVFPVELT